MSARRNLVSEALADWLPLVEATGPFLTLPVLRRAFPNGLERVEPEVRAEMRQRHESLGDSRAERAVWLRWVLADLLGYKDRLREGPAVPDALQHTVPEHGVTLRPDFALVEPGTAAAPAGVPRLLVEVYEFGTDLTKRLPDERWTATPVERMALLCRATGVELGLITDTNAFTLVWAPRGGAISTATWLASLWSEERGLFDAFTSLLGARRFFAVAPSDTLGALLAESASAQVEVTNQLGLQVRQAVELLVDAFSRANRESGGRLLDDSGAGDLETAAEMVYGAAVTVMMRLVFLLYAEERRLFPLGDDLYDESYAVSTLLETLRADADLHGEEMLERRTAAWHRLLATFRMVHDGVQHETLRIPAYGGGLFDPDRYPFLEGRRPDDEGRGGTPTPPAVSDRSVMAVLGALQWLSFRGESRRVSFRSLDVEQIGHVYEGLLDHGCQVVDEIVVGLKGSTEAEAPLAEIEAAAAGGREALVAYLQQASGMSGAAGVGRLLDQPLDADTRRHLLEACENDPAVFERVRPYVGILRRDLRGLPVVFLPGAVCVTQTSSRRDSGTEYTTRELADEVVRYTLEPLVYAPGPAEGVPPSEWKLKTAAEILALRICDPAVGSGAILVAACRYLAERLVEAWAAEGEVPPDAAGDPEGAVIAARRVVVDHCLFGVDRNPMAAEMAKLSLWLVTMAKERPFTFLDHAIQSGDSLIGIQTLDQVRHLHIDPARGQSIHKSLFDFTRNLAPLVERALDKVRQLSAIQIRTVRDAEEKARLNAEANEALATVRVVADVVVAAGLAAAKQGEGAQDALLTGVAPAVAAAVESTDPTSSIAALHRLRRVAQDWLATDAPAAGPARVPLHWPLAFPEVFQQRPDPGFDAIIGNPPFRGGKKISGSFGIAYREFLVSHVAAGQKGNADLVAYFFLRTAALLRQEGCLGLLATNSLSQGENREVGLDQMSANSWTIYRAVKSRPWPGAASVQVSLLWMTRRSWTGARLLDELPVSIITPGLVGAARVVAPPRQLHAQKSRSFQGSVVVGTGFLLSPEAAADLIARDARNRDVLAPYLSGEDLNSSPTHAASRWAINFFDRTLAAAQRYPDCLAIVERLVKPDRMKVNRKAHRDRWWQYGDKRPNLYAAIADLKRVLVIAQTSSTLLPTFVANESVFSHMLIVFAHDDYFHFGLLSSTVHTEWARRMNSTLGSGGRYFHSDCFETFPEPSETPAVTACGEALFEYRSDVMRANSLGLTALYNRVHDPASKDPEAARLREMHVDLDRAVLAAYGWHDSHIAHDFVETQQGLRFSFVQSVRDEVLDRLVQLNHSRYAEEVRLGLHDPRGGKGRAAAKKSLTITSSDQGDLLASVSVPSTARPRKRS